MLEGSEFQFVAAATEKARRAISVRVFGTVSCCASDGHRDRTGTEVWIRSLRYAGVEDNDTLNVSDAILLVTCCLTDNCEATVGADWSLLASTCDDEPVH